MPKSRSNSTRRSQRSTVPPRRSRRSRSTERERPANSGTVSEEGVLPPPTVKREKRTPATQDVPLSTPGREHVSTRPRTSDCTLGEIKAMAAERMSGKDGEDWWRAIFSTTLPNKSRVTFRTTKEVWAGKQHDVVMHDLMGKS